MIRPERTTLYAVYWPEEGVLKVGRCWRASRYRELCATGGEVIFLMRDVPIRWELCVLAQLDEFFPPAFENAGQSEHILPRGRGFTECFQVPAADVLRALDLIYEGIVRYGDDKTANGNPGGVRPRGADQPAPGGATDGDLASVVCGRSRPGEGERPADAGELLSDGRGQERADDRGASADAGRRRLSDPVRPVRVDVLRDGRVADDRPAETVAASGAATCRDRFATASRFIRGGGEGERARGSGRERPRPNRSRRRPSTLTVLHRPPSVRGNRGTLPKLRPGPPSAQGLGRRTDDPCQIPGRRDERGRTMSGVKR